MEILEYTHKKEYKNKLDVLIIILLLTPLGLPVVPLGLPLVTTFPPMVPLAAEKRSGSLVTIGTIGRIPNACIGNFTNGTIGRQMYHWLTNGTIGITIEATGIINGTIGRTLNDIVIPLVPSTFLK